MPRDRQNKLDALKANITEQQAKFAELYALEFDMNIGPAAREAYPQKNEVSSYNMGRKALQVKRVAEYVKALRAGLENNQLVDKIWIMERYKEMASKNGGYSENVQKGALADLAKIMGMFTEKSEISINEDPKDIIKKGRELRKKREKEAEILEFGKHDNGTE